MNAVMNCLCCPFRYCCPCFQESQTSRTAQSKKTVQTHKTVNTIKSDKTVEDIKDDPEQLDPTEGSTSRRRRRQKWETMNKITSPKDIKDSNLTEEYAIPEEYPDKETCFRELGFNLDEQIGSGTSGTVYKVVDIKSGQLFGCKEIKLGDRGSAAFKALKNELFVMCKLQGHENLVTIIKHFIIKHDRELKDFCYIIMELADGNCLDTMVYRTDDGHLRYKRLPEPKAKNYFRQMSKGLLYLHQKGIAHKDFKLQNVLVFKRKDRDLVKLTDFGLSRISFDSKKKKVIKARHSVGTLDYMSPQVLRLFLASERLIVVDTLREYDPFKADCWALGVCLYIMITAEKPFNCYERNDPEEWRDTYNRMKQKQISFSPNVVSNYSSKCLLLIKELLEPDPGVRLSMDIVLGHKWLNS